MIIELPIINDEILKTVKRIIKKNILFDKLLTYIIYESLS